MSADHSLSKKNLKREIIVSVGATIFLLGLFTTVLLFFSKSVSNWSLWITLSIVGMVIGWVLTRTQTKGFVDTLKTIFGQLISAVLSPINWF